MFCGAPLRQGCALWAGCAALASALAPPGTRPAPLSPAPLSPAAPFGAGRKNPCTAGILTHGHEWSE